MARKEQRFASAYAREQAARRERERAERRENEKLDQEAREYHAEQARREAREAATNAQNWLCSRAFLRQISTLDPQSSVSSTDQYAKSDLVFGYFRAALLFWQLSQHRNSAYEAKNISAAAAPFLPSALAKPRGVGTATWTLVEAIRVAKPVSSDGRYLTSIVDSAAVMAKLPSANTAQGTTLAEAERAALEKRTTDSEQPLWPNRVPPRFDDAWRRIRHALVERDEGWQVWIDWYERRLRGGYCDDRVERAYVVPDDIWAQGALAVNAHIAAALVALNRPLMPFDPKDVSEAILEAHSRTLQLQRLIGELSKKGHNKPPELIDFDPKKIDALQSDLDKLRQRLPQRSDRTLVAGIFYRLRRVGKVAAAGAVGGAAGVLGKKLGEEILPTVWDTVLYLIDTISALGFYILSVL